MIARLLGLPTELPENFPGLPADPADRRPSPLAGTRAGRFALVLLAVLALTLSGREARAQEEDAEDEAAVATRESQFEALVHEVAGLEKQSNVLKKVVKLVSPTVVHIEAEKTDQSSLKYGRRSQVEEAGSGFIITLGGHPYVITNRHVIKQAALRDIRIRLADARVLNPLKVWTDPDTDIAVMAINAPSLVVSRLGNSDETEIGDFVLAVGSPFGLSHSVTFGIISAKGRRDLELGDEVHFQDFMQTDAAINPGNSGGPLLNLRGEVIGMNTAIASSSGGSEGIGFTIPVNMVKVVARQLVERGSVIRAYLGVGLDANFSPAKATSVGLRRPARSADYPDQTGLARRGRQAANRRYRAAVRRHPGRQRQPPDQPGGHDRAGQGSARDRVSRPEDADPDGHGRHRAQHSGGREEGLSGSRQLVLEPADSAER